MKKLFIFLLLTTVPSLIFAQEIMYDYDLAGNRVLRKISTPLPVTLISFTAIKKAEDQETGIALLNWRTSSEINADMFSIERSRNTNLTGYQMKY